MRRHATPLAPVLATTLAFAVATAPFPALAAPPEDEAAEAGSDEPAEAPVEEPSGGGGEVDQYDQTAKEAFAAKDFDTAADNFIKAYEASGDPNYLFNIGRVYEEAGNIEKSVEFYDKFVQAEGVSLDNRSLAVERLKVLKDILNATKQEEEEAAAGPQPEQPETPPEPEGPTEKQRALRISGFTLLGVGAAGLIVGGVMGGLASSQDGDIQSQSSLGAREDKADDARRSALVADVSLGVGAGLLVVGAVLVGVGYAKPKNADRQARVAPTFNRRGGGVAVTYNF